MTMFFFYFSEVDGKCKICNCDFKSILMVPDVLNLFLCPFSYIRFELFTFTILMQ